VVCAWSPWGLAERILRFPVGIVTRGGLRLVTFPAGSLRLTVMCAVRSGCWVCVRPAGRSGAGFSGLSRGVGLPISLGAGFYNY
jgi:hypothetical protein